VATVAMLSVFAGVGSGQAAAQPKPLVNADVVKMVKAGLDEDTIVLAIRNRPSAFDTSPEQLIGLKKQGVTQAVLNAMLNASQPTPAAPATSEAPPPQPDQQAQADQPAEGVWVGIYGTCPQGEMVIFKPTIYANQVELARLACNTYFYVAARPGTYKFCATKGHCTTAAIGTSGPYFFRVLPTTMSYSIGQMDPEVAEEELQRHRMTALDLGRVLAPKMVTTNTNGPPAVFLSAQ
jgi:hypothetical protein